MNFYLSNKTTKTWYAHNTIPNTSHFSPAYQLTHFSIFTLTLYVHIILWAATSLNRWDSYRTYYSESLPIQSSNDTKKENKNIYKVKRCRVNEICSSNNKIFTRKKYIFFFTCYLLKTARTFAEIKRTKQSQNFFNKNNCKLDAKILNTSKS